MLILLVLVFVLLTISLCIAIVQRTMERSKLILFRNDLRDQRILLVTAHPDDETMFFAPTILALQKLTRRKLIYNLCLSNGDAYGHGAEREKEIVEAFKALNLEPKNLTVLNVENLKDGKSWASEEVVKVVSNFITRHDIEKVVTFDTGGVSGHKNHIAIATALKDRERYGLKKKVTVAYLQTVPLFRKYSSIMDIWLSLFEVYRQWPTMILFVSSMSDILRTRRAMMCHRSQDVWYRRLYMCFSRYVMMNTLLMDEIK